MLANMLGLVVVAVLGRVAQVPAVVALAWLVSWPLLHLALLMQPALAHYGGLSGVLHAGVAVVQGAAYGISPHMRISIAYALESVIEGGRHIARAVDELR